MANDKKLTQNQLFTAIALIVIGVLFCCFRSSMLNVLLTIVGAVLIVLGGYDLYRKQWVAGAIELVLGIVIIVCGWTILELTLVILGAVFVVYGIYTLIITVGKTKSYKDVNAILGLVKPILAIIFGILLIVSKWVAVDWLFIIIGVLAIIDGVLMLIKK